MTGEEGGNLTISAFWLRDTARDNCNTGTAAKNIYLFKKEKPAAER
jgi:hypothetical protein